MSRHRSHHWSRDARTVSECQPRHRPTGAARDAARARRLALDPRTAMRVEPGAWPDMQAQPGLRTTSRTPNDAY